MSPKKIASSSKEFAKKDNGKKLKVMKSTKAGLIFPVARLQRSLKVGRFAKRVGTGAGVYLAATLEYLVAELLDISGKESKDRKRKRIIPRHISLAMKTDDEFLHLFKNVTISEGGVFPHIEAVLLPKKSEKRVKKEDRTILTDETDKESQDY